MIEIYKDYCPACHFAKFNTNIISRKLQKHGLSDLIPIYRMKVTNEIPYLGKIPHTPIHIYIAKEGQNIVEIKLLESPYKLSK